ncbi:MAG: ABC transporter ATP-binding protein [Caldicoprobacterales bacterium]|jgi:ABC-type cobalamin/Fe3+-siderophores transport system ATPase subunit|nr:ABC transporter ATP-binding protein [Clostridia bacterium]MDI9511556.1 ABC transporter ATP-binding protein [Bacillota bacterium]NLH59105.1 ABC transporter ATP-binding protein [Clostridiales bacterium]
MIKLEDISSGYNKITIIKDINISFNQGTITSIIGKNGCGKTTLLRTASNLLKPFSGKISVADKPITDYSDKELARKVSFLPQLRSVPNITVYNLVMHGRYPYLGFSRTPQKHDKEIVDRAIEEMNLASYVNKNIQELSGGQRQKVYIAMVLAQNSDIIFLDEPTTYLDINHQLEILQIVKRLKQMGKTIIMVLHDLSNALSYSDNICLMEKGQIAIYDSPEGVYKSGKIEEIFNVCSQQLAVADGTKQYVFYIE